MQALFSADNKKCVVMSIDDFYYTGAEQDQVALMNSDNPILKYRGSGNDTFSIIIYTYNIIITSMIII